MQVFALYNNTLQYSSFSSYMYPLRTYFFFTSSVWPLSIRNAYRALHMESRDVRMSSNVHGKFYVVRCVVTAGEMLRNSCLS